MLYRNVNIYLRVYMTSKPATSSLNVYSSVYYILHLITQCELINFCCGLYSLLIFGGYFHAHIFLVSVLGEFCTFSHSLPSFICLAARKPSSQKDHKRINIHLLSVIVTGRRLLDLAPEKRLHDLIQNNRFILWAGPQINFLLNIIQFLKMSVFVFSLTSRPAANLSLLQSPKLHRLTSFHGSQCDPTKHMSMESCVIVAQLPC